MTLPAILLGLLVALLYGVIYHLIRGGSFWRLLLYLSLSLLGFVLGYLFGLWQGESFIPLGTLDLGYSSIGSLLCLILGDWLSRIEVNTESKV